MSETEGRTTTRKGAEVLDPATVKNYSDAVRRSGNILYADLVDRLAAEIVALREKVQRVEALADEWEQLDHIIRAEDGSGDYSISVGASTLKRDGAPVLRKALAGEGAVDEPADVRYVRTDRKDS